MENNDELQYIFCEGLRKGSQLLYLTDLKQIFKKKSSYKNVSTYHCYKEGCSAKVVVNSSMKCFHHNSNAGHNHMDDQEKCFLKLKAISDIKKDTTLLSSTYFHSYNSARTAYDLHILRNPSLKEDIDFDNISRNLQRIAAQSFPRNPNNINDITSLFDIEGIYKSFGESKHEVPSPFYRGCIDNEDGSSVIFASTKIIDIIQNCLEERNYIIDGTFKIVPRGPFKQLLIVFVDYKKKKFPFLYILMTKRTKKAYKILFEHINDNIFNMNPNSFVTDFEKGLRLCLKEIYPDVRLIGCWFHFCQALRRQIVNKFKPLRGFLKTSQEGMEEFKKIMHLPLLPDNCIEKTFQTIRDNIKGIDNNSKFEGFLNYFEKQWIKQEKPEFFSVFDEENRTTSAAENYNGQLLKKGVAHGNFFKFVALIQKDEFFKSEELQKSLDEEGNEPPKKKQKLKDEKRQEKITYYTKRLKDNRITPIAFLEIMIDSNSTVYDFDDDCDNYESDDSSVDDKFEEDADIEKITCGVCFDKIPNMVLLPCKHLKTCNKFHLILQAEAIAEEKPFVCVICRQEIRDSIQVFN